MLQVFQSEVDSRVDAAVVAGPGGIGHSLRSAAMSHQLAQAEQALEAEREVSDGSEYKSCLCEIARQIARRRETET